MWALANPAVLWLGALIPALYLLIRRLPPPPRRVRLPTIVLIGAAEARPVAARRPPVWLLLIRLGAAVLLLVGLAGPERRPPEMAAPPARLALVIDNGWTAAGHWPAIRAAADGLLARLPEASEVVLFPTAQGMPPPRPRFVPREAARAALAELAPRPWPGARAAAAEALPRGIAAWWVADGVAGAGDARLRAAVAAVRVVPPVAPVMLAAEPAPQGWSATVARPPGAGGIAAALVLQDAAGRRLARAPLPDSARAELTLTGGADASAARLALEPAGGAAAVQLLAGAGAPPRVALVDGERAEGAPPLARGAFFVRRALEPHAPLSTVSLAEAVRPGAANFIVLIDEPVPGGAVGEAALARAREGVVILSFAGPRLAARGSAASPVRLAAGGARALGGVLAWEAPQALGGADPRSPLAGFGPFPEARVRRQLIGADAGAMRWAWLADGTPLISARREGRGLLILVHTAASPAWSSLPLTGALQDLLVRLLPLASDPARLDIAARRPFLLERQLMGDGSLAAPERPVALLPAAFARAVPSPGTPPGIYRSGELRRPLNLQGTVIPPGYDFPALDLSGLRRLDEAAPPLRIGPWLAGLGLLLLALDGLLPLLGRLGGRGAARLAPAAAALMAALIIPAGARGQAAAQFPVGTAFIPAGDALTDARVRSALQTLGLVLTRRTAVAALPPVAAFARPGTLGAYPLIYWPLSRGRPLSASEAAALAAWIGRGGLLVIEPPPGAGPIDLRAALGSLDLPPLERLTGAHVLARAFYRLEAAPGGLPQPVWVEAGTRGDSGRVAAVVMVPPGFAGRAGDTTRPYAEREAAWRLGINLYLYALTGTYKADQVHAANQLSRGRARP